MTTLVHQLPLFLPRKKRIWDTKDLGSNGQFARHLLKRFLPKSDKPQKFVIQTIWDNLDEWGKNWHNKDQFQQLDDDGNIIVNAGTLSFLPRKYLRVFLKLIRHDKKSVDIETGKISGKDINKDGTCRKRRSNGLHTVKEILKFLVSRTNFDSNNKTLNHLQLRETSIDCIVKALEFSASAVKKSLKLLVDCDFLKVKTHTYLTNNGLFREGIASRTLTKLFFSVFGLANHKDITLARKKNKKSYQPKKQDLYQRKKDKKDSQNILKDLGVNQSKSNNDYSPENQQQKEQLSSKRQNKMMELIKSGVGSMEARAEAYKLFPD